MNGIEIQNLADPEIEIRNSRNSENSGDTIPIATTRTYNANSNRTQLTYPDGNIFAFGYDPASRMTHIGRNAASGLAAYGYNSLGLRSSLASGSLTTYGYDAVSRLNLLTQDIAGTAYDVSHAFAHNPASQMTGRTASNDNYAWTGGVNVNRNYAVNGLNQYTNAGATAFGYDANGNLTGDAAVPMSMTLRTGW